MTTQCSVCFLCEKVCFYHVVSLLFTASASQKKLPLANTHILFAASSTEWAISSATVKPGFITLRFGSKTVFCCSCMHLFSSVAFWNLSTPSYDSTSFAGVWIQNDNTKNMRSSCDAWIQGPVFRVNKGVPILQPPLKLAAFSISFPVLCHSVFATLLLRYLDHSQNQVDQNWFKCSYGDRKMLAHLRFYSTPRVCLHPTQIHLVHPYPVSFSFFWGLQREILFNSPPNVKSSLAILISGPHKKFPSFFIFIDLIFWSFPVRLSLCLLFFTFSLCFAISFLPSCVHFNYSLPFLRNLYPPPASTDSPSGLFVSFSTFLPSVLTCLILIAYPPSFPPLHNHFCLFLTC